MKNNFRSAILVLSLFISAGLMAQYKAGDIAGDFNLKNVDGNMVSLSQYPSAKGFIVVFTCNTCPVAMKYEKRIQQLSEDFGKKDFPLIAISSNDVIVKPGDSYEEMQKKAKSEGFTFPYLYDESQEVAKRFGATHTPHVFVLAKEGQQLVVKYTGAIDNNTEDAASADKKYVADAVNSVLEGKDPVVSSTKAIGCSIKWKN